MSSIIINNSGPLSHQDIQEIFDTNRLGSVSKVTILPEYDPDCKQTVNKAYILVEDWYDTESAFHFIKETQSAEGSLMHYNNNNFYTVNQTAPTNFHKSEFKSKWTQDFQNKAKQEFIQGILEFQAESEAKEAELEALEAKADAEALEAEYQLESEAIKTKILEALDKEEKEKKRKFRKSIIA
jgi:hypothetical protein